MLFMGFANGKDIYVAKSGNNNNTGTELQPYLTISKAAQVAVSGDVVIVKQGIYREIKKRNSSSNSCQLEKSLEKKKKKYLSGCRRIKNR